MAASIVPAHKQASAVATMFMGLTIANIGGVPSNMVGAKHWLAMCFSLRFPCSRTLQRLRSCFVESITENMVAQKTLT